MEIKEPIVTGSTVIVWPLAQSSTSLFLLIILLRNSFLPLVMDAVEGLGTTVLAAVTAVTAETLLVESDCITGEEEQKTKQNKQNNKEKKKKK